MGSWGVGEALNEIGYGTRSGCISSGVFYER